jgi:hypothetical protein
MVLAMLLAHLVGDYILQWDSLSRWKSEAFSGVLVHGLIVTVVTLLFALPFDPSWWPWAIFIGVTHTIIDGIELPIRRRLATQDSSQAALTLFITDQVAHITIIVLALIWSGYLHAPALLEGLAAAAGENPLLAFIAAYAFLTMPAWIITKFFAHGLVDDSAPDFSLSFSNKYFGMLERGLIATLILFGQFLLVPVVALPRIFLQWSQTKKTNATDPESARKLNFLYIAEVLTSIALAIAIGLGLRNL